MLSTRLMAATRRVTGESGQARSSDVNRSGVLLRPGPCGIVGRARNLATGGGFDL